MSRTITIMRWWGDDEPTPVTPTVLVRMLTLFPLTVTYRGKRHTMLIDAEGQLKQLPINWRATQLA